MKEQRILPMSIVENEGIVMARELVIEAMDKTYVLTVGTPEYVNQLKITTLPDVDATSLVFVVDNVQDFEKLKVDLIKQPLKDLMPFLIEQKEDKE